ncbi:MAG: hypothetical protein ACI4R8_01865 [Candidatus Caccovivens sp.]
MKKKFSLLLLALFIVPIFALFGCNEAESFPVTVFPSWGEAGSVSGNGTYKEGETVTLTAVASTIKNSSVVAWVYQNSREIVDDNTYKIVNETNSAEKVTKSTLTFVMSESTQGRYTAVFDESKLLYTKLTSWRMTSTPDADGELDDGRANIMTGTIEVSQGENSSNLTTAYTAEEVSIKDNVTNTVQGIDQVLELSSTTARHIKTSVQLTYNGKIMTFNLRADINNAQSTEVINGSNYNYQIKYEDGTYKIIFGIKLAQNQTYYLILEYKTLNKI